MTERESSVRAGAGYKPKTMATGFLAPSVRQAVHPVRRLPQHSAIATHGEAGRLT